MQEQHVDVMTWLKKEAIPFTSIAPDDESMSDLNPFGDIVEDARMVVCGDATYGTHEFFRLKHRLWKFLVERKGFTLFAIEDGLLEVDDINQYVLTGKGDVSQLLAGLRFWIWRTQEMVDLVQWMRSYNERRGERPALQLLGLDMQSCDQLILQVLAYIDKVDAQAGEEFRDLYANFWSFKDHLSLYKDESLQFKDTCWSQLKYAQELLVAQRNKYEAQSSPREFAYTLQCANCILQAEQMFSLPTYELRRQFIAENASWHLEQAGPQAKMFIWTHNGLAAAPPDESKFRTLGSCLYQKYGKEFKAFGMLVAQGTFNAQDPRNPKKINVYTLDAPSRDSYEYIFQSIGLSRMIIDLQQLPDELYTWLSEQQIYNRSVGIIAAQHAQDYWVEAYLPQAFDGIFYLQDSTPTRLLAP